MVSGMESQQSLTFPFNTKIDLLTAKKDLTIKLTPHDTNTDELLSFVNLPFTVRAPINIAPRLSAVDDFKVVRIGPGFNTRSPIIPASGMKVSSVWDGDVDYIFRQENINNFLTSLIPDVMPPTIKYFKWTMDLDQDQSESKSFTMSFNYVRSGKEPVSYDLPEFPSDPLPLESATTTTTTTMKPTTTTKAQETFNGFTNRRRQRTFLDRITSRLHQRGRYQKFQPPIERENFEPAWKEKEKKINQIQSGFTFLGGN
ncbi:unnamed protein product, partial [Meganyctiphanes norvegica]